MSRPVDIPTPTGAAAATGAAATESAQNSPTTASILAALRRDLALSPHEAAQRARGDGARVRSSAAEDQEDKDEDDDEEENENAEDNDHDHDTDHTGAAAAPAEPVHPPPPSDFAPFYTLITDPTTTTSSAHVHPTAVHYLFADDPDGAGLLTDALLGCMPAVNKSAGPRPHDDAQEEGGHGATAGEDGDAEDHRIIIVDLGADGREVLGVASLSPHWQALTASIAAAPSWRGGEEGQATAATGPGGLMLKIAGSEVVDIEASKGRRAKAGASAGAGDEVEGLLREFDSRLGDLDRVLVVAGEE